MDFLEFKDAFKEELDKINIKLDENQCQKFYNYMNLLIEWNKKINLTAIIEPREVILKHFIDSLTISKYIKNECKVIDVGTGAGFPGIPIKIANPTIKLTLLDSLNKRIIFLDEVLKRLEIKDVRTIHSRAEEFGQSTENREKYDVVVSRAVARTNILLEYMIPLTKKDGQCICMKGANVEEEIEEAKNAIQKLGGKIRKIEQIYLSENENKRNIIIIDKKNITPKQYPRKFAIIVKSPL